MSQAVVDRRGVDAGRVDIWHGLLWSRYKGVVFSDLHALAANGPVDVRFYQVCETRSDRAGTPVDLGYHDYPYVLLFPGEYNRIPKLRLFWRMFKETWRSRADLVLLGGYGRAENWVQMLAAVASGKSVGVFCDSTLNDHQQTWAKSLLKRLFFSRCRIAFCYGERSAELARRYGVPASRVVWPIATAALPDSYGSVDVADLRRRGASPRPCFLYVGRLSKEKNLTRLLEAFAQVRSARPEASLRLVGEGPQERALRDLAADLNLRDAVEFTGSKAGEDLYREYSRATCLVLPSESEPWGLVVNEALSYGCPVVVSDRCGCVPELVVEGETGFITPHDDVGRIAAAMTRAADEFTDVAATAQRCLRQVSPLTPQNAARRIYDGCVALRL